MSSHFKIVSRDTVLPLTGKLKGPGDVLLTL